MKVLIIGSGGREHALAWKLAQSAAVSQVYVAPGNGGTALETKCQNVPLPGGDPSTPAARAALIAFAAAEGISLTLVGPEAPLAAGIVDAFRAAGLVAVGPDARSARLESSKAYSKAFMETYGVRTAKSRTYSDYGDARAAAQGHFESSVDPLVVKADGLAAGKGVVVAASFAESDGALRSFMLDADLGAAGRTVVLEAFLPGKEVSVLAAVSVGGPGTREKGAILPFLPARDHKRRYEGDGGPNTGGMGAIAPVPDFSAKAQADFRAAILEPTLRGMETEGFDYRGFIFFGLMVQDDRCFLLEYNVRLGDPETQAVLPLMESDLTELCQALLGGRLMSFDLRWKAGAVCAPVAVAEGYPGPYRKGDPIEIDRVAVEKAGAKVFIAGAVLEDHGIGAVERGVFRTSGGRVLAASSWGTNPEEARDRAYRALGFIHFDGIGFRRDIGR